MPEDTCGQSDRTLIFHFHGVRLVLGLEFGFVLESFVLSKKVLNSVSF